MNHRWRRGARVSPGRAARRRRRRRTSSRWTTARSTAPSSPASSGARSSAVRNLLIYRSFLQFFSESAAVFLLYKVKLIEAVSLLACSDGRGQREEGAGAAGLGTCLFRLNSICCSFCFRSSLFLYAFSMRGWRNVVDVVVFSGAQREHDHHRLLDAGDDRVRAPQEGQGVCTHRSTAFSSSSSTTVDADPSDRDLNRMYCLIVCMQESSRLKEIPVVIMSSENVPTRISRLPRSHAQPLNLFISFQCF